MTQSTDDTVSFGYSQVTPEEKTRKVGEVFSSVARKYDIMNDAMSGGMHRLWKDRFVKRVKPQPCEQILDMAGGTGDIAFRMAAKGAHITVADINQDMLDVGAERALAVHQRLLATTLALAESAAADRRELRLQQVHAQAAVVLRRRRAARRRGASFKRSSFLHSFMCTFSHHRTHRPTKLKSSLTQLSATVYFNLSCYTWRQLLSMI